MTNSEEIKNLMEKMDWRGIAKAFAEGNLDWHAEEWKNFIEEIRRAENKKTTQAILKKIDEIPYCDGGENCKCETDYESNVNTGKESVIQSLKSSLKGENQEK